MDTAISHSSVRLAFELIACAGGTEGQSKVLKQECRCVRDSRHLLKHEDKIVNSIRDRGAKVMIELASTDGVTSQLAMGGSSQQSVVDQSGS